MARVQYDYLDGLLRVTAAGETKPDQFVIDVLIFHAALEVEIDELLKKQLRFPEKLKSRGIKLTFGQKVAVLAASWKGTQQDLELLCNALLAFNDLRNAVAHVDQDAGRNKSFTKLVAAYQKIHPKPKMKPTVFEIALNICAFMGDDPGFVKTIDAMDALDDMVNRAMPEMFGSMAARDTDGNV